MAEDRAGPQRLLRRVALPLQEFINTEVFSGGVLLLAALVAIAWANSPWDEAYGDLFGHHLDVNLPLFHADESVRHWINDGLMTLFFFVVGLEIKREFFRGELKGFQRAVLPGVAALGGMIAPALIFTAINAGSDGADGWGIPMATDIAFALGLLALVGSRIPSGLRVFLLALAIVDDIGAILVIAVFYSGDIQFESLALAAGMLVLIVVMQRAGVRRMPLYAIAGLFVWAAMYESGVHATIAGVALGLLTPFETPGRGAAAEGGGPLARLEHVLHPYTSFAVVPLFALANAGVSLNPDQIGDAAGSSVGLGVALGLLVGKPLGILVFSWAVVRTGVGRLPDGVTWGHMASVGLIAGVGFTVALFVNELAFDSPELIQDGKLGIIGGSLASGVVGLAVLRLLGRRVNETALDT